MWSYALQPGIVHDTVTCLSLLARKERWPENSYLNELYGQIGEIPATLFSFLRCQNGGQSILEKICSPHIFQANAVEELKRTLNRTSYIKQTFYDHFFPGLEVNRQKDVFVKENDISIRLNGLEEKYILLTHFTIEESCKRLFTLFEAACDAITTLHTQYRPMGFLPDLSREKLIAIGGNASMYSYSYLLLSPTAILYNEDKPGFFLLGEDYAGTLEYKYRHSGISPYTFARAISSPVRFQIFKLLSGADAMTQAEIGEALQLGRSEFRHHLKEMADQGILIVRKDSNKTVYSLDRDFIGIICEQLTLYSKGARTG